MAEIAKPSQDPGNDGTMAGMLRSVFDKLIQQLDDMLPATVISYDRLTNRACVQPMIAMVTTEKTRHTRKIGQRSGAQYRRWWLPAVIQSQPG